MEDISEMDDFFQKFKNKLIQDIITTNSHPKRFEDVGIRKSRKAARSESGVLRKIYF